MSKFRLIQFFTVFTLVVFLFAGCGDDDDDNPAGPGGGGGSNSITLNGGGFNNSTVSFPASYGAYDPQTAQTYLVMSSFTATDTISVYIGFDGKTTGNKAWVAVEDPDAETFSGVIVLKGASESMEYYIPKAGQTQVTAYGNVGAKVTGSYSGTIINATTLQEVTISGNFDSMRGPDGQ